MKSIILHSGGLDSTVCLLQALEQGRDAVSLGIDYGQRSRVELVYAEELCVRFGVHRRVLEVKWDKPDREYPLDRTLEEMRSTVSPGFLPGRNALFLILASAEAAGMGASEVWIGVNCIDYSGYPDCRPEFVSAFREMMRLAIPGGPEIVTPLLHMTKPDIAREAFRLGLTPGDTWSCYTPVEVKGDLQPCERCDACKLHKLAWDVALDGQADIEE